MSLSDLELFQLLYCQIPALQGMGDLWLDVPWRYLKVQCNIISTESQVVLFINHKHDRMSIDWDPRPTFLNASATWLGASTWICRDDGKLTRHIRNIMCHYVVMGVRPWATKDAIFGHLCLRKNISRTGRRVYTKLRLMHLLCCANCCELVNPV